MTEPFRSLTRAAIEQYQAQLIKHDRTPNSSTEILRTLNERGFGQAGVVLLGITHQRAQNQVAFMEGQGTTIPRRLKPFIERAVQAAFTFMVPLEWFAVTRLGKPALVEKIYANTPLIDWTISNSSNSSNSSVGNGPIEESESYVSREKRGICCCT